MARAKWCFTLHNYTAEDEDRIKQHAESVKYCIFGREVCPTTGRRHLQGYVHFKTPKRLSEIKRIFGATIHAEIAKGSAQQNKTYCSKTSDFWEVGELENKRGLTSVVEEIRKGTPLIDIAREYTEEYIKFHRGIEMCCNLLGNEGERNYKTKVSYLMRSTLSAKPRASARGPWPSGRPYLNIKVCWGLEIMQAF